MDINKVTFGEFSIGAKQSRARKEEQNEETEEKSSVAKDVKSIDAEAFLEAMSIAGIQNKAQISRSENKEVNPSDFLDEKRITDIEAMMGKFEDGVSVVANAIESEFPGFFAPDTKNALAAKIFAQG